MASIQLDKLCQDFEACLGWPYRSPGGTGRDCSKTGIDCSGMFVRAYKLQGASIYHGSNTIWRKYLSEKGRLTNASQLEKGMVVFKHKVEDTAKYPDGEGDFSHMGLVTSVRPLRIVHASTVGMKVRADTALGKEWTYWGRLAAVDYGQPTVKPEIPVIAPPSGALQTATVAAPNGGMVKLRAKPSTKSNLYWEVPSGTTVEVLEEGGTWWHVRYGRNTGYMMDEFLSKE